MKKVGADFAPSENLEKVNANERPIFWVTKMGRPRSSLMAGNGAVIDITHLYIVACLLVDSRHWPGGQASDLTFGQLNGRNCGEY